ncbi:MAG: hypothetical protein SGI77_27535 [Pirellulaceae bacterium]|nr:hypothetical protein [Pirellulaceae bacterium]
MKAFACLVRQTPEGWIISIGDAQPMVLNGSSIKPDELVQAVLGYLDRERSTYGACKDKIVLCPEARSTLFASSPLPTAIKKRDRQQLKFHAESLLPIDAERMAASFVTTSNDLRVIAIDTQEWQPIVEAFSLNNLHFCGIAPTPMLALEEANRTLEIDSPIVVWEEDGACDLWLLDKTGVVKWTHLETISRSELLALRLFATQSPEAVRWTAINCSPTTLAHLNDLQAIEVTPIDSESQVAFASRAADRLCRTSFESWFDLRDGVIAGDDRYRTLHGWMRLATAAVFGLMIFFAAACFWRSAQAERQQSDVQEAHKELFQATFPGVSAPSMTEHMRSQYQVILGSRNGNNEIAPTPSALEVLHATLEAIATDGLVHVEAERLVIAKGVLDVKLLFQNREDASYVAERLKKVGFETGPTNALAEKGKWSVTFQCPLKAVRNSEREE